MNRPKTIIIVQCRYRSSRLPGKAILPLIGNMSMLEFLLRRLKLIKNADNLVLTTGKHTSNNSIKKVAKKLNVTVSEGNEKNVLERFCKVANSQNADVIVRICADNPLTDPFLVSKLIDFFISKKKIDHLSTFERPSLPYGSGCAIFSKKALQLASSKSKKNKLSQEHVEPFMLRSKLIKTHYYKEKGNLNFPNLRLSVDYKKDYEFIKPIANYLYKKKKISFTTEDIIKIVNNPKVALFANGDFGLMVTKFLKSNKINIGCLITHPDTNSSKKKEIIQSSKLSKKYIFDYNQLKKNKNLLKKTNSSIALSCWSSYILNSELINSFPLGAYNFHNSLLPSLGGSGANIWAIINKKISGVTMHKISTKVDSGPIIDQKKINYLYLDTGYSLLKKQYKEMLRLLKKNWSNILLNKYDYIESNYKSSFYKKKNRDILKKINLNKKFRALDLINILRAYQFSNKDSAYFQDNKKLYNINIKINYRKNEINRNFK